MRLHHHWLLLVGWAFGFATPCPCAATLMCIPSDLVSAMAKPKVKIHKRLQMMCAPNAQSLAPLDLVETAFLDMITVKQRADARQTEQEAYRVYRRHGIVRLCGVLTPFEASSLVQEAANLQRRPRKAFGQFSHADRHTIWIAGSNDAPANFSDLPCAGLMHRALNGDLAMLWRSCVSSLGASHLGLAEVVTSMPGGAAQAWHQDGAGITIQIALCRIGLTQGPTEIRPRIFTSEYLVSATSRKGYRQFRGMATAFHRLQRPVYKRTSAIHSAIWESIGPRMTREQMVFSMNLGILPPPPLVRLTADAGMLILYDAGMRHRGGANRGSYPRPILAVHMRAREGRRTPKTFLECYD